MRSWVIPATIVVAAEYVAALLIGFRVGFHYSIPFAAYLVIGLMVVVLSFAGLLGFRLIQAIRQSDAALDLARLTPFAAGVMLVTLQMAVLTWTKVMLPLASPFWADPLLASGDRLLFLGDPWRLTHAVLGSAEWLDAVYVTWAPIKMIVLVALLVTPESRRKSQALLAYFLIFACGVLAQYLFSSAGPIFYERLGLGSDFSQLTVQPLVQAASDYLWQDYLNSGGSIGSGISAMPSLHVALALWVALVVRSYLPRLQIVGWTWFGLILVGSVHLGWHYALDGIAAVAMALAVWTLVRGSESLMQKEQVGVQAFATGGEPVR